jgi:endonuclease/exonuclease/phosphatase family metal-dependent hydrolase
VVVAPGRTAFLRRGLRGRARLRIAVAAVAAAAAALGATGAAYPADGDGNPLDVAPAANRDDARHGPTVTVMTRNLFIGTDLGPIFSAPSGPALFAAVARAWEQVQASRFPERADALADEIARAEPDLVGLQEAALYRKDMPADGPFSPAETVELDFLDLLLDALAERGYRYEAAASIEGTDAELPAGLPPAFDVRLTDRVVVLVRRDGRGRRLHVSEPRTGHYAAALTVPTVGGPITLKRGWASVTVRAHGRSFRFITTHLEAFSAPVQVAQGDELARRPAAGPLPVVLVGDFNSRADGSGTPTYANLVAAGFADAWSEARPGEPGLTCCHGVDLREPEPRLVSRIDLVLTSGGFRSVSADVVGDESGDRTTGGLWPSDHAGVVATLRLPRADEEDD